MPLAAFDPPATPGLAARAPLRRLEALLLMGAAASVLSACASVPHLGPAPQPKPASAYAASESFTAPAADWPQDRWWTAYGDPQLSQLIEEALAGSPDLIAAQARVRQSDALADQVRSTLGPHVEGVAALGESKLSYNNGIPSSVIKHGWNDLGLAALSLNWQIDFFGKNRALLAAATSSEQAAEAEAAAARLTLSTAVAAAYADLNQLYADRDAAEAALRVRVESEDLIDQRFAQGLETQAAADRAHAGRAAAEAELAASDEAIGLTRNRIAALLGQGPDRGLAIGGRSPGPSAPSACRPISRPSWSAAGRMSWPLRLTASAAAHRIKAAKADFYPNVNLVALIGVESLGLRHAGQVRLDLRQRRPGHDVADLRIGPTARRLPRRRADYDAAVATYDQTLIRALKEVADSAVSARALDVRLAKSREALAAPSRLRPDAASATASGLGTYLDVLIGRGCADHQPPRRRRSGDPRLHPRCRPDPRPWRRISRLNSPNLILQEPFP